MPHDYIRRRKIEEQMDYSPTGPEVLLLHRAYKNDKLFVISTFLSYLDLANESAHFWSTCTDRKGALAPNLLGESWAKLHIALALFTSLTSINPFILSLVPEAQGCRLCPELIRSQIAGGLSPYCAPSSGIILVLILTAGLLHTLFFFFSPELSF